MSHWLMRRRTPEGYARGPDGWEGAHARAADQPCHCLEAVVLCLGGRAQGALLQHQADTASRSRWYSRAAISHSNAARPKPAVT